MEDKRYFILAAVAVFVLFLPSSVVQAVYTYDLDIFTSNGPWGVGGISENDPDLNLFVEIYNGSGTAKFKFRNENGSSLAGVSITDVYFDDGTLLAISSIENGAGVLFSQEASPSNLPSGHMLDPNFVTTAQFSADADPPPAENGVDSGEYVIINFDLQWIDAESRWATIDDVIAELADGTLRIGAHIQGFAGGSSESAVGVPEPATIALLGLGAVALLRKRKA